jgi:hypothetical protein
MNDASALVIRWLLIRKEQPEEEIERLIGALTRGAEKRQEDSIEMIANLIFSARAEAQQTEDMQDIERLIELHFKLQALTKQEAQITVLQEIRKVLDLPKALGLQTRIRSRTLERLAADLIKD